MPIVTIASMIPTFRPPDELIIESTEMSGTDSIEEVLDPTEIARLRDPFRDKLVEIARGQGGDTSTERRVRASKYGSLVSRITLADREDGILANSRGGGRDAAVSP